MDFYDFGKLIWWLAAPPMWLVMALAWGLLCLWRNRVRSAKNWIISVLGALVVLTFVPIANPLLAVLENRFAQPDVQKVGTIVILGGSDQPSVSQTWNQPALNAAGERVLAGLAMAAANPSARVIYSGRNDRLLALNPQSHLEAQIFALGNLDADRFIRESASRSTFENAQNTAPLLATKDILLVTSAWHMPRAVGVFCAAGITVLPYPVDYRSGRGLSLAPQTSQNLADLSTAVHEYIGLAAYYLSGRTTALFPKGC